MAKIIFDDIKWADPVSFEFGKKNHKGIVSIVDKCGGGQHWGVCTSYDIMAEDKSIYKHIPHVDICKIEENQLSDDLIKERNEILKRKEDYINKKMS